MKQVISETLIHILSLLAAVFRSVKPDQIPDELKEYFKGINLVFKREFIENNTDREIFHSLLSQPLEQKLKMISDYFENLCGKTDIILQDRIIMLLHIIRYVTKNSKPDPQINTVLKILSDKMNLTQDQFDDLFKFTTLEKADDLQSDHFLILSSEIKKDENLLEGSWIENNIPSRTGSVNAIETDSFKGTLIFVYLPQLKSFIVKKAETDFHKNPMLSDDYQMFDILGPGDELRLNNDFALEYHEIKKKYLQCITKNSIRIAADKIEYYYNPPVKGIKEFSFKEETGELIGIVGQDGVGKTTLLKLIAGEMKPDKGTISINGFDLNENNYLLKGILGNVTESDMLFDELTVYENIYLAAKFFFSSLSEQNLKMKISDLMDEIGLTTISNVQVGSFSDKNIQPGQRRLVNIALELLREPDILLVDDAIERLSMSDTSKVIKVLHHYTFKGKLVITTISQTSESVFRMFDKIWIIDEGGYPIF